MTGSHRGVAFPPAEISFPEDAPFPHQFMDLYPAQRAKRLDRSSPLAGRSEFDDVNINGRNFL